MSGRRRRWSPRARMVHAMAGLRQRCFAPYMRIATPDPLARVPAIFATERDGLLAELRQQWFPPEFRIALPVALPDRFAVGAVEGPAAPVVEPATPAPAVAPLGKRAVAEIATFLWYLKTKHFQQDWLSEEACGEDPRARRTLGRLRRLVDTLAATGIDVHDPTGQRYPKGGEAMMKPIQLQPTAGVAVETVTETVVPIVYRDQQLIQRGEVFVAIPPGETRPTPAVAPIPSGTLNDDRNQAAGTDGSHPAAGRVKE